MYVVQNSQTLKTFVIMGLLFFSFCSNFFQTLTAYTYTYILGPKTAIKSHKPIWFVRHTRVPLLYCWVPQWGALIVLGYHIQYYFYTHQPKPMSNDFEASERLTRVTSRSLYTLTSIDQIVLSFYFIYNK